VRLLDLLGLRFSFQGPDAAKWRQLIECWKTDLPKGSLLRKIVNDLDTSEDSYTITDLKKGNVPETTSSNPIMKRDPPTTTSINPKPNTIGRRTWSAEESLAHELLHAHDYYEGNAGRDRLGTGQPHSSDDWKEDEAQVTREARSSKCRISK
jgi:hypothetical protein